MSLVHLHLLLNHVPVVGMLFVLLALVAALRVRRADLTRLAWMLTVGLGIIAAVVFFTGEPAEEAVEHLAGVSERVIHQHEEAAEVAFVALSVVAALAVAALAVFRTRDIPRGLTVTSLLAALVVSGMMAWTASLGGQIRHTEIGATAAGSQQVEREGDR